MRQAAILALLALVSCASVPAAQRDITSEFQGGWGGPHIGLQVGARDARVELDCAEGRFSAPYVVNRDGTFAWDGAFTRGTGGPVQVGAEPPEVHAVYTGVFRGGRRAMTLQIRLDDGQIVGPFTLERSKDPQLTRCL